MSDGTLDVRPGGLDILSTGLNLAELDLHGGEGVWDEVARYSRDSSFETQVDAAMSGRSAPRVWAVMESPGSGPGAAAAGLAIARILADRGQAVVLVDGDEQESRITRWLGRNEMEGWIDMVRFGASLHAASDPLPSDNRRGSVLGVGSFAPTGVTPDEVADLLARLRRQADDLVLVLPAKLRSQPWFEASHIKLLCWDLLSRSAADTEKVITELDRMGSRPDVLLGYGVEEFSAIQVKLREDDREDGLAPLPPEDAEESVVEAAAIPPVPEIDVDLESAIETEAEEETETEFETEIVPEAAPGPAVATVEIPAPADEPDDRPSPKKSSRRSSGIFVFAAVVAVACLIMLGVFLAGQRGGADGDGEQNVASARMDSRTGSPEQQSADPAPVRPVANPTDGVVDGGDEPGDQPPATLPPSDAQTDVDDSPEHVQVGMTTPDAPAGGTAADTTPAVELPEPEPEAEVEQGAAPAALDMAAFQLPVGQDGWALWLYSFPELDLAEAEIRELARRGIRAEYRTVDIEGKGRWFRVYVGSFADRAGAKSAVDGLKAKLKHDWVVPARI